jgi:hypothetical protein
MLAKKPSKEENYQYLAKIFKSGGVDTKEKAQSHIDGLIKKSRKVSIIPALILVLGGTFAPKFLFFWLLFSLMGTAWIWSSTFITCKMMKRYIAEEFAEEPPEDTSTQ